MKDDLIQAGFSDYLIKNISNLSEENKESFEYWESYISRKRPITFLVCEDMNVMNLFAINIAHTFMKRFKSVKLVSKSAIVSYSEELLDIFCYIIYDSCLLGKYEATSFKTFLLSRITKELPVVLYFTDADNITDTLDDSFLTLINSRVIQIDLKPSETGRLGIGG